MYIQIHSGIRICPFARISQCAVLSEIYISVTQRRDVIKMQIKMEMNENGDVVKGRLELVKSGNVI